MLLHANVLMVILILVCFLVSAIEYKCQSQQYPTESAPCEVFFANLFAIKMLPNRVLGQLQKEEVLHFLRKKSVWLHVASLHHAEPGKGVAQPVCLTFCSGVSSLTRGERPAFAHAKLQLVCLLSGRWPLVAERREGLFFPFLYFESCSSALKCTSFQSVALMCVREMWSSCVKCSAAPSRMKTAFVAGRTVAGVQGKEIQGERERVTDASVHQTEDRNSPFAWPHTQEHASPQSVLPLAVFSFFCPLEITESAWSLTPVLFEMEKEMTLSICAYFPLLWITHAKFTLFTPHFSLIIHWFTAKWCVPGLIRVALAEFFHKSLVWDSSESKRGSTCCYFGILLQVKIYF